MKLPLTTAGVCLLGWLVIPSQIANKDLAFIIAVLFFLGFSVFLGEAIARFVRKHS